jgi:hypothetical protein
VEGVKDVIEAEPGRGPHQRVLVQLAAVEGAESVQELAGAGGGLLVGEPQVLAQVPREGDGELLRQKIGRNQLASWSWQSGGRRSVRV